MEHRHDGYRVRLLGELAVFTPQGEQLTIPSDRVMKRLLIAMALRAGQPRRTEELIAAVWPGPKAFGRDARSLETPASRLRSKLQLPIPSRRGEGFYKLDMTRGDVDALDFIDRTHANDLHCDEIDALLGMWQGNPQILYSEMPATEWDPLLRAVRQLLASLSKLGSRELGELKNFRTFAQLFPEETGSLELRSPPASTTSRRILIVENEIEIAKTMSAVLYEHNCTIATSLEEAMAVLTSSLPDLDAALIDLHLTDRLDSAGLEILSYIRDRRPDLPKLLITASPPPGSQEQMRRTYGLFDIIVKGADGYSASGVRDAVTHMLGEEDEDRRRRVAAVFESQIAQIQKNVMRGLVLARRRMREGHVAAYPETDQWTRLVENLDDESEELRRQLKTLPADALDSAVEEFVRRWREKTAK